ncbi:IS66 family transposase [Verminephrobacter aporrectodeae]|uniref:IS66 family transposase n=1 Tax=Verminephrobacter aporrectodeae TaxID=1110389 RepID=UPI0022385F98|nr:IS66 family transposase [Verminephrobacter aporrectodeae]
MQQLPDLSTLSSTQMGALVLELWAVVQTLTVQNNELQARLNLNSRNSSKPPSSDGLNKPQPKSLRKAGQRPVGGQKGHKGHTLSQVAEPNMVVTHAPPEHCDVCHGPLGQASLVEARQVHDLPDLRYQVTEHRVLQSICNCGKTHRGVFPAEVTAAVQYGPRAKAAAVHLNQYQMLPLKRTGEVMGDLFDMPMSEATILSANAEAAQVLAPTVTAIAQELVNRPIVHADETGLRVNKSLHWLHALVTEKLTWLGRHEKRGMAAFVEHGILPLFKGTLVHDGWTPYRMLDCVHSLCNAHHVRELTYVQEQLKQDWAGDSMEVLLYSNSLVHQLRAQGQIDHTAPEHLLQVHDLRSLFEATLAEGDRLNPRAQSNGRRGRIKQSKVANLIGRLRDYSDDVWRFMTDPNVPFTNNLAEQAVRMPKVKQKISGCFRTSDGADIYCIIRSYLATLNKQGAKLFDALTQAFLGSPVQPRFG